MGYVVFTLISPTPFLGVLIINGLGGEFDNYLVACTHLSGEWWVVQLPFPLMASDTTEDVLEQLLPRGCKRWVAELEDGGVMVGFPSTDLSKEKVCSQTEVLRRICEPLGKGKKTEIECANDYITVKPPEHPFAMNWYMPKRSGKGLLEVRPHWKSQADTFVQVTQPGDRHTMCRPKRFLVARAVEHGIHHHRGLSQACGPRSPEASYTVWVAGCSADFCHRSCEAHQREAKIQTHIQAHL